MYKVPTFKSNKLTNVVSRAYVPLMSDYFLQSYSDPENFKNFYKINFFSRVAYIAGSYYYGPESKDIGYILFGQETKGAGDLLLKKEKKELGSILRIFDRIYAHGESLLKFSLEVKKTDFSKYSQKQLLQVFDKFSRDYILFCISLMGFNIQFVVEENLRNYLQGEKDIEEELAILTFPDKQNIAAKELTDLLRLRIALDKAGVNVLEKCKTEELRLLKKHADKYGWINARGAADKAWTVEEIFVRAKTEKDCKKRLVEMVKDQKKQQLKAKGILKSKKYSQDVKNLIKIAKELVYFRTYRTDYLNWIFFNVRPLFVALASKIGIGYEDVIYYLQKEIKSGKRVSAKEISKRKESYALALIKPHELWFSSNPKKISEWKEKYTEVIESKNSEIKGMPAFKGVVRGRAVLVLNKADMIKVKTGDVLISFMTTPDMAPVMQKAIAFVTDEGGITCHAAIIAREIKKPCVIGTKVATQVFKDGDMVEVDADRGIVKKIN